MYAAPVAATAVTPPRRGLATLPIIGICCLILILFLIAATIVLALIPIYLPTRDAKYNGETNNYYFLLTPNATLGDDGAIDPGVSQNISDAISERLGFSAGSLNFDETELAAVELERKKRGFSLIRTAREAGIQQYGKCRGRFQRRLCRQCRIRVFVIIIVRRFFIKGVYVIIEIRVEIFIRDFSFPPRGRRRTTTTTRTSTASSSARTTTSSPPSSATAVIPG